MIALIVGLILTILCYGAMTVIEDAVLNTRSYTEVLVFGQDTEKGTKLEQSMFRTMRIDTEYVPTDTEGNLLTATAGEINGTHVTSDFPRGAILLRSYLVQNSIVENGTRQIAIQLNNKGNINGAIRTSDYVDLYLIDDKTEQTEPVLKHVFVDRAYSTDGIEILNGLNGTVNITITVSEETADMLIDRLSHGATVWATLCREEGT